MIDGPLQRALDPALRRLAMVAARAGFTPDGLTVVALALGLGAAGVIAAGGPLLAALTLFLLGRLADGLDGALARQTATSDRGAFLDIVFDFCVYGAVPLAFALRDPVLALPAAILLASFYINGGTLLAFAVMAERRGIVDDRRPGKGLRFTAGLAEGAETILVFTAMMLFPAWFSALAHGFAALCLITAGSRIALAWRLLAPPSAPPRRS